MTRQQRRKAMREERKRAHQALYDDYITHLPKVNSIEPGRMHYAAVFHDDWCALHDGKECNCDPHIELHVDPKRS